jgi:hypothetical protein
MSKINVTIKGIVPLLQHRYPDEKPDSKITKVRGTRDYSDEAEKALYKTPEGVIYQPADHILGAIIKAATEFKITGRGRKSYKDLAKTALAIYPEAIPHKNQKYEIDRRPVVVQRARIMRERPKFTDWELSFAIEIIDEQFSVPALKEILEAAGKIGIGDFRPRFGRFMVTQFKEEK